MQKSNDEKKIIRKIEVHRVEKKLMKQTRNEDLRQLKQPLKRYKPQGVLP